MTLSTHGIAFIEGGTFEEFVRFMQSLGKIFRHPDADEDGVTRIVPDGRLAQLGAGFTSEALSLHTDRAATKSPPRFLGAYFLQKEPGHGGDPLFCPIELALSAYSQDELGSLHLQEVKGPRRFPVHLGRVAKVDRFRLRDDNHFRLDGPTDLVIDVRQRILALTYKTPWFKNGDAYILDNTRVLHGRTPFNDPTRTVARILIEEEG